MHPSTKLICLIDLVNQRPQWHQRVVATNGCFDILHWGHCHCLNEAKRMADGGLLVVGLNSDASVRELKGPQRPVNPEHLRALVLASLECVDYVCIFESPRATLFLRACAPHLYVKSGEYTSRSSLNEEERHALEECGSDIAFVPPVPLLSTTAILNHHKP